VVSVENRDLIMLRNPIRRVLRAARRSAGAVGAGLIHYEATRDVVNWLYENTGWAFRVAFDRAMCDRRPSRAFDWKCHYRGRAFFVPVRPDVANSWNTAQVWDWWGFASHRRVYEAFVDAHPQGVFMDIGANDGTHTYAFALQGYTCVAFEPQPRCLEALRRFCERNRLANVTFVQTLVGEDAEAEVDFYVSPDSWVSSRLREHTERFGAAQAIRMPSLSIDAYCEQHGLSPSFVKIDVEGWEWPVLNGGRRTIAECRPAVLAEIQSKSRDKARVWDLFAGLDYECLQLPASRGASLTRIATPTSFMASEGYSSDYLFCGDQSVVNSVMAATERLPRRPRGLGQRGIGSSIK
jgi:FkbM family methyltransferase